MSCVEATQLIALLTLLLELTVVQASDLHKNLYTWMQHIPFQLNFINQSSSEALEAFWKLSGKERLDL